jgi:hypothetical protein
VKSLTTLWFFYFGAAQDGASIVASGGARVGGAAAIETVQFARPAGGPAPGRSAAVFQQPSPFPSVRPARLSPDWHATQRPLVHAVVGTVHLVVAGAADIATAVDIGTAARLAVGGDALVETECNTEDEVLFWLEAA